MTYAEPNLAGSGPSRIGISVGVRAHAYDPDANPKVFAAALVRRVIAHDMLVGTVIINDAARAASLRAPPASYTRFGL
jgi:hypothetical protein